MTNMSPSKKLEAVNPSFNRIKLINIIYSDHLEDINIMVTADVINVIWTMMPK